MKKNKIKNSIAFIIWEILPRILSFVGMVAAILILVLDERVIHFPKEYYSYLFPIVLCIISIIILFVVGWDEDKKHKKEGP